MQCQLKVRVDKSQEGFLEGRGVTKLCKIYNSDSLLALKIIIAYYTMYKENIFLFLNVIEHLLLVTMPGV